MPIKDPLAIPEIAELVAPLLTTRSLAACIRVSKSWRNNFQHHHWSLISIGAKCNDPFRGATRDHRRWHGPYPDEICRHRHFIQHLLLLGDHSAVGELQYPNLTRLMVESHYDSSNPRTVSLDLIQMCPSLTRLDLAEIKVAPTTWATLSTHPHIRTLYLRKIRIETVDMPAFWNVCMNLESLMSIDVNFRCKDAPVDMVFHRMRPLTMRVPYSSEHLQLPLYFPMLTSLKLIDDCPVSLFDRPVQNNHWPHLNELHLSGLLDSDMASILRGVGDGTECALELVLDNCRLGTQATRIFGLAFNLLVNVEIRSPFYPRLYCSGRSVLLPTVGGSERLACLCKGYCGSWTVGLPKAPRADHMHRAWTVRGTFTEVSL